MELEEEILPQQSEEQPAKPRSESVVSVQRSSSQKSEQEEQEQPGLQRSNSLNSVEMSVESIGSSSEVSAIST